MVQHKKIGIAMSGGVDSSVTASILKQNGFDVHGFFMLLPLPGIETYIKRVQNVAEHLDIPLHLVEIEGDFRRIVVDYFIETYQQGRTPNPCVICNKQIKFGALLKEIQSRGMDKMATGHYARIVRLDSGACALKRGRDPKKDQSYFLCRLSSRQLQNLLLPLGELTKKEVYDLAAEMHLSGIHGPESQDICFLAGETVSSFFAQQGIRDLAGDIVTVDGRLIGRHRGLWHYTTGQRRGLGLPDATPWYVKCLDAANNRLIVCKNNDLFTRRIVVRDVLWNGIRPTASWQGHVQIRGRHPAGHASVSQTGHGEWSITFEEQQRAVTPGQFAVFYREDIVVGSGVITDQPA
jgi:tRNA-specific 2-thiouridylase